MPRVALRLFHGLAAIALAGVALAMDPHMDPGAVPGLCSACHLGHGESRSPMLPAPQKQVCLSCHDSQSARDRGVLRGTLAPDARPRLMSSVLSQPFQHPVSDKAYSRREPGVVTCTSCHSPHRGSSVSDNELIRSGGRKPSPRDRRQSEFELCVSCHGSSQFAPQSPQDIGGLTDLRNRSYHPVAGPARTGSRSVRPERTGREMACTDCHGNADPEGPRGPHGSAVRFILRAEFTPVDGNAESPVAYALCYECHDREQVLDSFEFPEHGRHIVNEKTSCSTCHDPHGSVENRSLIRFDEEHRVPSISPSALSGRLEFVSDGPGSGACYMTCHGYDHAPASY